MKDHGFKERMQQKTDEELLAIVQSRRNEFQRDALIDAATVLRERGIEFQEPAISPEESAAATTNNSEVPYGPLIVGILMVLLAFYEPNDAGNYEAAFTVNLTLNLFIRAIVMIWSHSLATRFGLKKVLWVILGFVFGGWTLIAITIAIGIKLAPNNTIAPEPVQEDDDQIPTDDR